MNAKEEFLELVQGEVVVAAEVRYLSADPINPDNDIQLYVGHTPQDFEAFLNRLDFEYDSGYGGQELYGTVWFENGAWAERREYDGSEWWSYVTRPAIPFFLSSNHPEQLPPPPEEVIVHGL